jgi:hypothetical protein
MEIRSALILLCVFVSSVWADARPDFRAIKQFPLDDRTVYTILISRDEPTTIMFPSALTALEGAGITTDPEAAAPVFLNYSKGRYYFSVRALQEAATGHLNVIWNKHTYVLTFQTDPHPFNSVTFYQPTDPRPEMGQREGVGPTKLLGLLDRAKAYHLIQSQYPEALPQIDTAHPHRRMLYKDFEVEIAEVFRFDPEDTLIFKLLLYNTSDKEICYLPQTLAVRVGPNVYYTSLPDASGVMPPGRIDPKTGKIEPSVSLAYFAVTGSPDGGRNNLAVDNPFNVIVTRAPEPVTLDAAAK